MPGLDKFQKLYWKDKILMMLQSQVKTIITGMLLFLSFVLILTLYPGLETQNDFAALPVAQQATKVQ